MEGLFQNSQDRHARGEAIMARDDAFIRHHHSTLLIYHARGDLKASNYLLSACYVPSLESDFRYGLHAL